MSSVSERLKQSAGGFGSAPKLDVEAYIDMGEHNGRAAFKIYDKTTKQNLFMVRPITGIFIGHAMTLESFDKNAGVNGGTWKSSVYFTKTDNVHLFEPAKDKSAFSGTVDAAIAFLSQKGLVPKKKYSLYILTDKGLLCIKTNVTLGINDSQSCKDQIFDHMVSLVPTTYDAKDASIPKKVHGYLGAIAATNPPKYAKMVIAEEINEDKAIAWGIFDVIDQFKKWREYKQSTGKVTDSDKEPKDESIKSPDLPVYNNAPQAPTKNPFEWGAPAGNAPGKPNFNNDDQGVVDDLPF